jgi:glycosyltransferase involved in cell wall biosynthesis
MKILHMVEHYLPFLGGVEVNTHEIAKRLVRDGFEVEVVCAREKGTAAYEIMDGVKIHRVLNVRLVKLRYDIGNVAPRMLLSTVKNDADIIHAHAYGFFPTYASMLSNKPVVITTHSDPAAKIYPLSDLSRSIPLKFADQIVATTQMEKAHLIHRGARASKIVVIPNGIDLASNDPSTSNHLDNQTILCLARLDIAHKGQDILLKAMPKVISKVPKAKLWLAGTGKDASKLRNLTEKLKITGNVEFKGAVTDPAKSEYLRNCRVLCVTPRTESFGVVYLEAMANGLPIVTTRVGGIPEVVQDSALLVPPNDPSDVADALIEILTNDAVVVSLHEKGLERAKKFDWDSFVRLYEKMYENLLG